MSDFLYPFLSGAPVDRRSLVADLTHSAQGKIAESAGLRSATLRDLRPAVDATASALAERFSRGGRMLAFGNGGSSTDAASLATLFAHPPTGPRLAARTLTDDSAVLTALGNDVGYELVFSRQLIALGGPNDIALGMSTSGNSANLLTAFREARGRGMLTIGIAGYAGGAMAESGDVDHLLVVRSESVHRIQETQAGVGYELWRATVAEMEHR